jgi:peptidyl-prolyl cis-trans isomerase SurA
MMLLKRSAVSALLSCLFVFSLIAQPGRDRAETLFTINKKPVTTEEFVYLYRKNHQHKPEEFTKEKIGEYLDLFINYKLKVEEALFRGMDSSATFKKEYQTYRDELLKPYLPDSKVVDSLVVRTYERLKEEVNASHILIMLKPDALPADTLKAYQKIVELRERAVAGEDFSALAALYSEEPGANVTKGNLGYFTAMQMVFPFEQAAYLTPVGGVSKPVRTQFGYHILKVLGRQPSRGEVEVSHIMIRAGADDADEEAKNTIFDIYDKLHKGMDWEELCQQFSEDPNSKDKGGKLRPFGVGAMSSAPQFQEMAFSLQQPGDISDPVRTQFGWHILRLEARIPLPSFDELKASLTQRVSRDERVKISKDALQERLRKEFKYQENSVVKLKLMSVADSLLQGNASVAENLGNETLFTMKNKPYRVRDFMNYLALHPYEKTSSAGSSSAKAEELMTRYVDAVLLQILEEKVISEVPDYKWLIKEYYEGILLFEIMEKEIWNKAMEDSAGQMRYFREHAAKYQAGERMAAKIFSAQTAADLTALKDLLEAGDTSYHTFIEEHRLRVDSGSFEKTDRAVLSRVAWSPGKYLVTHNGTQYLVFLEKVLPPGPETFDEARASVISDYQTYLENSWITELKRKFEVKVEKKAKKRAFDQLMGK